MSPEWLPQEPQPGSPRAWLTDHLFGAVVVLTLAAIIVGVWLIGELLPKINPAWLFVAFIAGFVVGVGVLTAVVKPLLKRVEADAAVIERAWRGKP